MSWPSHVRRVDADCINDRVDFALAVHLFKIRFLCNVVHEIISTEAFQHLDIRSRACCYHFHLWTDNMLGNLHKYRTAAAVATVDKKIRSPSLISCNPEIEKLYSPLRRDLRLEPQEFSKLKKIRKRKCANKVGPLDAARFKNCHLLQ